MKHFNDEILSVEKLGECDLVEYADDLSLATADLRIESLKSKVDLTIRRIYRMHGSCLKLVSKWKVKGPKFSIRKVEITPSRAVKYLGSWLDNHLSFGEHVKTTKERAERSLATI